MSELDKMPMGEFYKQLTVTLTDRLVEADDKLDALRSELSRLREHGDKRLDELNDLQSYLMSLPEYGDGQLDFLEVIQDIYKRLHEEINDSIELREQMRWRKYPEEKPELGKAYLVRYLFSITYLTETPTADWISRGTFDVFGDGKWTVDSQTPLKVVIVTHFRELPQPPEEA